MSVLNNLVQKVQGRPQHFLLGIFLVLYILLNVETPLVLAKPIDTIYGNVLLAVVGVILFLQTNAVLGVIGAVAIYELIKRSAVATGAYAKKYFLPSERLKMADFAKFNDFPVTLEEEMVAKMAPLVKHDSPAGVDYKPVLAAQYDAAPLNESN